MNPIKRKSAPVKMKCEKCENRNKTWVEIARERRKKNKPRKPYARRPRPHFDALVVAQVQAGNVECFL